MTQDDIYSKAAKSIVQTLPLLRLKVYHMTKGLHKQKKHHDHRDRIPPAQFITIMILSENGPMPMGKLAKLMSTSKPSLTMLIDRMEKAGYVERKRSQKDGRVIEISLTEVANDTLLKQMDQILDACKSGISILSEDDVNRLNELINEMSDIFNRIP